MLFTPGRWPSGLRPRRLLLLAACPLLVAGGCGGSSRTQPQGIALRAEDAPPGFALLKKVPYAPFARVAGDSRRQGSALTRLVGDAWLGGFTTTFGSRDRVVQSSVDVFRRRRIAKIERAWAHEVLKQWGLRERRVERPPQGAPGSWRLLVRGAIRTPPYRSHPAARHPATFYFWQRGRLLGTLVAWSADAGDVPDGLLMAFGRRQDAKFRAAGE